MRQSIFSRLRSIAAPHTRSRSDMLGYYIGSNFDDLTVSGYTSLLQSPDVAAVASAVATIIASATICLMRNTPQGDVRVRDRLSRFMDIHPYSLGTRKTLIEWIIVTMLTAGNGNAFVLPMTEGGLLADLLPMPGATVSAFSSPEIMAMASASGVLEDSMLMAALGPTPDTPMSISKQRFSLSV